MPPGRKAIVVVIVTLTDCIALMLGKNVCKFRREMKEGAEILTAKIQRYRPKIAVFNGKGLTH